MLMTETSATLRALAENEEFESSVDTTSRVNKRILLSILLSDSDKDTDQFKRARKQVFAMLVSTASLTKRKIRAKKSLKDYSAKVANSNPDMATVADACSELIGKFPTKSSTRDSMMPSWPSVASAFPDLATHFFCHSPSLSSEWVLIESRLTPGFLLRSEWLQLNFDESSLNFLLA
eukprot:4144968-Amphidinium_carterae.1